MGSVEWGLGSGKEKIFLWTEVKEMRSGVFFEEKCVS
jgi:hypothetical protein